MVNIEDRIWYDLFIQVQSRTGGRKDYRRLTSYTNNREAIETSVALKKVVPGVETRIVAWRIGDAERKREAARKRKAERESKDLPRARS